MKFTKDKVYSIKDYKGKKINLIPKDIEIKAKKKSKKFFYSILVIVLVCVVIFFEGMVVIETKELKKDTKQMETELQKLNEEIKKQNIITSLDNKILEKELLVEYIENQNEDLSFMINTIEENSNDEIYFNTLNIDTSEFITITAQSKSTEAISLFLNNLINLKDGDEKLFESVFINSVVRSTDEDKNELFIFDLNIELKGGSYDETK